MTSRVPELKLYELTEKEVSVTNEEVGRGSYATVMALNYKGLKCVGKKIHDELLVHGKVSYQHERFQKECWLLSQVRHPNIVQFLGIHFQDKDNVPILVMEYLPTNLTDCIEQYGILSKEISFSILHDVALGLCYLHNHIPNPIVHRDLSSNNILLTINMVAKISDLGVARIVNLSQHQAQRMTEGPGTPIFMPPEVTVAEPVYGLGVDIFSYGIIIIHMFAGTLPKVYVPQAQMEGEKLIPFSEAERRAEYLELIGKEHPLIDLIRKCIHNDPSQRPSATDIVDKMSMLTSKFPLSYNNQLEMLQVIKGYEDQMKELEKRRNEMMHHVKEREQQLKSYNEKINNIKMVHSAQFDDLCSDIEDLKKDIDALHNEKLCLEAKVGNYSTLLRNIQQSLQDVDQYITDLEEPTSKTFQVKFSFALPMPSPRPPIPPSPSHHSTQSENPYDSSHYLPTVTSETKVSSDTTTNKVEDNTKDKYKHNTYLNKVSKKQLTFTQELGSGHKSTVWKGAMNKHTNVAIKQVKPGTVPFTEYLQQATIMSKLQHCNVLKLFAVCVTEETAYIVTELMEDTLLQHLRVEAQSLSLAALINMSVQIAEGMAYLGKEHCIHRDLAARNILIGSSLTCKIAKFQSAQIALDGTVKANSNDKFPIRWTACETLTTYPHESSTKSDVWSFGVLLWEMITYGCLPYSTMTNSQAQKEMIKGYRMPCPTGCPNQLYAIMLTCWRDEPADRPTFETLQRQLKEISPNRHAITKENNTDLFKMSITYDPEKTTIYDYILHQEVDNTFKDNQCETVLIQSKSWSEGSNKQHVQVTEELKSLSCSGQFSVYKGLWNKTTPVAIKRYSLSAMSTLDFVQQTTLMAKLQHPNVSKFYTALTTENSIFTITELMKMNFFTYLHSDTQSHDLQKLIKMSLQVIDGMVYLEEQKCILRNLSACNIMIGSGKLTCKIGNFDLAQTSNDIVIADSESKFPVRWTAPEALIHCKFSIKSDVWSFGVLLWEIITYGSTPYPGMSNSQVREHLHQGYRMPCPNDCSQNLYSIMLECWKEKPNDRPSFTSLKVLLEGYFNGICKIYFEHTDRERIQEEGDYDSDSDDGSNNPIYQAKLDYKAQEDNELNFKKDDLFSVQDKNEDVEWYWGCSIVETNKEGFIPSNFLSEQPLIVFNRKVSKGTYGPIWAGLWNGETPSTIRLVEETSSYTTDILQLHHANIVEIYAVCHPKYIVMEPMKHGKLDEFLLNEGCTLKVTQLIAMSAQIVAGMAYLEDKNCILRNLAARNILVDDNLTCKVSNFSSARIVTRFYDSTEDGAYTYSESGITVYEDQKYTRIALKWTAPEAARGSRYSSRSDVWSFGILLSEIITHGGKPYPKMTNEETLENVLKGYRMPRPVDCPEKLYSIMLDCWNQEFTQRPDFTSLQKKLEDY